MNFLSKALALVGVLCLLSYAARFASPASAQTVAAEALAGGDDALAGAAEAQRAAAAAGRTPPPKFDTGRVGDHRPEAPPSTLSLAETKQYALGRARALGGAAQVEVAEILDGTLPPGAIIMGNAVTFNYADSGRPCGSGGAGCVR